MPAVNLHFALHHPYRLRRYTVFDLGQNSFYEDDDHNCDSVLYAASQCYLPLNDLLLKLIARNGKDFKVSLSLSGVALEQLEQYAPEVIDTFKALAATGCVEFLAEPYSHSLACIYSRGEFARQVALHSARIKELTGKAPNVFRNTELIYNNDIAAAVEGMGFAGILADGADHMLGWRSPNYVYTPTGCGKIKLLLNNYSLVDNVRLRFDERAWDQWPLTADKFAGYCKAQGDEAAVINLFFDYDTFGLLHTAESGIFAFLEYLPEALRAAGDFRFLTMSEVLKKCPAVDEVDVPMYVPWHDRDRDLNIWLGNDMQKDAIHALYDLQPWAENLESEDLRQNWLRLQSAEHFAWMCTKWFNSDASAGSPLGALRSPYASPYDAYINYMNVLADFSLNLKAAGSPAPSVPDAATGAATKPATRARRTSKAADKPTEKAAPAKATKAASAKATKATPAKATPKVAGGRGRGAAKAATDTPAADGASTGRRTSGRAKKA